MASAEAKHRVKRDILDALSKSGREVYLAVVPPGKNPDPVLIVRTEDEMVKIVISHVLDGEE